MSVYIPRHFAETDGDAIRRAIEGFPFATMISVVDGQPLLSHVPILVDWRDGQPRTAIGHVAAANPHAACLSGSALLVFQGPHGYISPSWYTTPTQSVPTWNYVAIHLRGTVQRLDLLADKRAIVDALSARHEARFEKPWTTDKMNPSQLEKMLGAIVGFRMEITGVEAKFKLGQNRSAADRAGVIRELEALDEPWAQQLAEWMAPYAGG